MWRLLGVLVALVLAAVIAMLPIQTHITFEQHAWQAVVHVHVTLVMVHIRRSVNLSDKVAMAAERVLKRWRAKGEPVKISAQKTARRFPRKRIFRAVRGPLRYFRKRIRVRRLDIHSEIGGFDAMQSALLAGVSWSIVGTVLAQMSRLTRLDPSIPKVKIVPIFAGPAYRLEVNCILRYRLGNAIVAGVWLLSRLIGDRTIRAWARDSWRRKGEVGSGRTSDSGPDEDGHGKP